MRLVNFGPGEIADRLTILALKILYGRDNKKDVSHFERERAALLAKWTGGIAPGRFLEHLLELAAVNAVIWQDQDTTRAQRALPVGQQDETLIIVVAFRLQAMNDRRAELISLININTGNDNPLEKL